MGIPPIMIDDGTLSMSDLDKQLEQLLLTYLQMPRSLRQPAIQMLRTELNEVFLEWFHERHSRSPNKWWAIDGWHSSGGAVIRNCLRLRGFDEKYFNISNLDDIYTFILEEAVGALVQCDRCHKHLIDTVWDFRFGMTGGFYDTSPGHWAKYADVGEYIVCDSCMWQDERYIKDYGQHT